MSDNRSNQNERSLSVDLNQPHTIYKPDLSHTLLDCDDTLLKTEKVALEECYEVLKEAINEYSQGELSYPASKEEFVHNHTGGAFRDMLSQFLESKEPQFNPESDERKAFIEKWSDIEQKRILEKFASDGIKATQGTEAFLRAHNGMGLTPVVVSSSSDARLEVSISSANLNEFFDEGKIFSAQNDEFMKNGGRRKPAPDVYLHAMNTMWITSDQAIAVEDSASGVKAALRAGLDTVIFVGANEKVPTMQESQEFIKEIYESIKNTRPPGETTPLGRIVAVTNDNQVLISLIENNIKTGAPFIPWQVNESINNYDLSQYNFNGNRE